MMLEQFGLVSMGALGVLVLVLVWLRFELARVRVGGRAILEPISGSQAEDQQAAKTAKKELEETRAVLQNTQARVAELEAGR